MKRALLILLVIGLAAGPAQVRAALHHHSNRDSAQQPLPVRPTGHSTALTPAGAHSSDDLWCPVCLLARLFEFGRIAPPCQVPEPGGQAVRLADRTSIPPNLHTPVPTSRAPPLI